MPSYNNFQNNYKKYSKSDNQFMRPKSMRREFEISAEKRAKLKRWITFYRRNIHRFVEHYFGIKLFLFQKIWIYLMHSSDLFMTIASRSISKSWLIGLYGCAYCTLYPGATIVIAAGSKKQAGLIVSEKIKWFQEHSPNIAREISNITSNNNDWVVEFHNGSKIIVVPATDLARGHRSNVNVYEEFRLIDKQIMDAVLSPFLFSRQPPYLLQDKYSHLAEEPKEIYISSCYYKAEWWYTELQKVVNMHYRGEDVWFIAFDYLLCILHNLKTRKQINKERDKMDEITFMQEYENIPFGENADAYFKFDMWKKNRNLKKPFYPFRKDNYDVKKKNPHDFKKMDGEIRIVSADIATRKGQLNDHTIIACLRLIPTAKGYSREVVYLETMHGENTILQALRIKQLFYDFNADHIVLDMQQAGIAVYQQLGIITKDEERGEEYPAMTVRWHDSLDKKVFDELREHTLALNALEVIYPISATAQINNDAAVWLRDSLQKGMMSVLIDEYEGEAYLEKKVKDYDETDDTALRAWYIHPYCQVTELINESVNLSMSLQNGLIKLQEPKNGGRKDRYTAVAYANYFAHFLDEALMKESKKTDNYENLLNRRRGSAVQSIFRGASQLNPFGSRGKNIFKR